MTAFDRESDRPSGGVPAGVWEPRTLLVGIGSVHGDDSIGRRVAEAILARWPGRLRVTIPSTPIGLIDQLDGVERLFVCDAFVYEVDVDDSAGEYEAVAGGRRGLVKRWRWPDAAIGQTSFRGTHDLSLVAVLRLAESIRALPAEVYVIGIGIRLGDGGDQRLVDGLTPRLVAEFDRIVDDVWAEIGDA
jgi:Ni,Fe-hydrogenase maturation factor